MAIALRAVGTALASGTRSSSVVPIPAGLSAGDEVTIAIDVGQSGGTAPTISHSGPATLVLSTTWGDGSYTVRSSLYRYRYVGSGDPSSFTFTHSSNVSDGRAIAHSGVDATTPDDATAVATTSGNTGPNGYVLAVTGITTANANSLVLVWRWSWDGNAITPPGGWTERIDQVITWEGEQLFASAGATGTINVPAGSSSGVAPAAAIVRALRESTGGGSAASGTSAAVSTTTGAPLTRSPAAGTSAAVAATTGAPKMSSPAGGTVAVVSTTSGTATAPGAAAGTVAVVSTVSGTASARHPASGTVTVVSTTSGTASTPGGAAGTVTVVSTTTGTANARTPAVGTVAVVSTVSGTPAMRRAAAGTVTIVSTTSGAAAGGLPGSALIEPLSLRGTYVPLYLAGETATLALQGNGPDYSLKGTP